MHSVVLDEQGDVYSWGNNDSGQLGREGNSQTPLRVPLEQKVDMISAGECHTIAANSQKGLVYFWGKIKNSERNLYQQCNPFEVNLYMFQK